MAAQVKASLGKLHDQLSTQLSRADAATQALQARLQAAEDNVQRQAQGWVAPAVWGL